MQLMARYTLITDDAAKARFFEDKVCPSWKKLWRSGRKDTPVP